MFGDPTERLLAQIKEGVKAGLVGGMLFEELNTRYIGPIDGHDIPLMRKYLAMVSEMKGPVLLHVVTEKGHGYKPAAEDPVFYHTPPAFEDRGGQAITRKSDGSPAYTNIVRDSIRSQMTANPKVTVITAAMCQGNKLEPVREAFPDRFFDVGICESHAVAFAAGQAKVGAVKVIRKFAYATILCVLTFCICMLPFAVDADPKWETGVWRVINVVIGCFLGAIGSIIIAPKSTTAVLHDKAARQVKMAGDAAEAVLHTASDFFAGRIEVNRLADDLLETPLESTIEWKFLRSNSLVSNASEDSTARADIALKKYEEAIADWRLSKMLFPLAQYDPFHVATDRRESNIVQMEIARTLARALRIQTTIVVMDGMVRNDADYDFLPSELVMFAETGTVIKRMLTVPLHLERSDEAAKRLFDILEQTRKHVLRMSTAVSGEHESFGDIRGQGIMDFQRNLLEVPGDIFGTSRTMGDENGRGIPRDVTGSSDNTLFFLQLVEHLILRSLRLYQAWKHVEPNRQRH